MSTWSQFDEARLDRNASWVGILDQLAAISDPQARREALDRLTVALWPELRRMSADVVLHHDSSLARFGADGESVVGAEFVKLISECVDRGLRPRSFKAILWCRATKVFAATFARATAPSGTVALARKRRLLREVQTQLRLELGTEPTMEQIAEQASVLAAQRRSDPKRQGMVFTAAHVEEVLGVRDLAQLDDSNDRDDLLAPGPAEDDSPISPLERRELARLVLVEAEKLGDSARRIAQLLWSPQLGDEPTEFASAGTLARVVGCTPSEATRARNRLVHIIPAQILASRFGITGA